MFNAENKKAYLNNTTIQWDDKENFKQFMEFLFDKSTPAEKQHKKDVAFFNIGEIMELYQDFHSSSLPYLTRVHGYYRDYAQFINPDKHNYGDLTGKMLGMCVDKDNERSRIIMRKELLEEMEVIRNPFEKALILGLFEGIRRIDFMDLTADDIGDNVVHLKGRKDLTISPQLTKILREAANTYSIIPHTDDPRFDHPRYTELDPDDNHVIKSMNNANNTDRGVRIRMILCKARDFYGFPWISASSLPQCGAANMLLDLKAKHPEKKIEDIVDENINDIRSRYSSSWKYAGTFVQKFGHLFK